jgi:hypothetical protein
MPSTLAKKIRKSGVSIRKFKLEPMWAGPCDPGDRGGVTQGMLSRFIVCRERFRLMVVEGLRPADTFNHRMEYGQMWHVCEEAHAKKLDTWSFPLDQYCRSLCKRYVTQQEQVQHWWNVCRVQFPIYVKYWAKHPDVKDRKPLLQEQVFHVPYKLPSGRTVYLRGKWDSVDLIGKGKAAGVYLQENKAKGDIVEQQLKRQLSFDLQTCVYLIAMRCEEAPKILTTSGNLAGVRYNVVRRPLSGGKGSIRQGQPTKSNPAGEASEAFYQRLREVINAELEYFFMRWKVEITPADLEKFEREFLRPCLEQLCRWWDHVSGQDKNIMGDSVDGWLHYRTPYGIYNVLAEGGSSDLDEYLSSGSELGLTRGNALFRELQ